MLSKDHPEIISLLEQLQAQRTNVGKVSAIVGYLNVDYLRSKLWEHGWNTRLADDGKTVVLVPREEMT